MIDPTSNVGEDTAETAPTCATCDEKIINKSTHRVQTRIVDEQVATVHFCDAACLSAFEE